MLDTGLVINMFALAFVLSSSLEIEDFPVDLRYIVAGSTGGGLLYMIIHTMLS